MVIVFAVKVVNLIRRINLFGVALFLYFTCLYILSYSLSETRAYYFTMICFISVFIVAPNLYRKHGRDVIVLK